MDAELRRSAMNQELIEASKPDVTEMDLTEVSISEMNPNEIRVIFFFYKYYHSNLIKNLRTQKKYEKMLRTLI